VSSRSYNTDDPDELFSTPKDYVVVFDDGDDGEAGTSDESTQSDFDGSDYGDDDDDDDQSDESDEEADELEYRVARMRAAATARAQADAAASPGAASQNAALRTPMSAPPGSRGSWSAKSVVDAADDDDGM